MHKKTIIYRGNLKSCNYRCSYCPFSKHKSSPAELEKDRKNFERFCESIEERAQKFSIGAVLVTPYGEASIHNWYWEGLARLSRIPGIDRVGLQTNLSFPVEKCLEIFDSYAWENSKSSDSQSNCFERSTGGNCSESSASESNNFNGKIREKLYIWATFHPEMTDVDQFVSKCHELIANNVRVCAGAVGVPENIPLLKELRAKLSPAVYLWINKMDGLRRNYTEDEIKSFSEIDCFFKQELGNHVADAQMCRNRCFVEADGKIHSCNISRTKEANWYDGTEERIFEPLCSSNRCSCYLAYGGRADFALKSIFGEYPLFRIPRKFLAIFFDLDGTLIPTGNKPSAVLKVNQRLVAVETSADDGNRKRGLSDMVSGKLAVLRENCPIFLATSMPLEEARKRLKSQMELFQGGIFASGAHLYLKEENEIMEKVYPISGHNLQEITEYAESSKARLKIYRKNDDIYKITLIKKHNSVWTPLECGKVADLLEKSDCRIFTEKNCLEIIDKNRNKGTGIEEICKWLGISPKEVLAVGNDREDAPMEMVCGAYIKK